MVLEENTKGSRPMVFANDYWSADYSTGIGLISVQLLLLILQLHDLRRLVSAIVSHNALNESSLYKLLQNSFALLSSTSTYKSAESESDDASNSRLSLRGLRNIDAVPSDSAHAKAAPLSIATSLSECLTSIASQSQFAASLARSIEREVLFHINDTIKSHEPQTRLALNKLQTLLEEYDIACDRVEQLKHRFTECVQTQDIVVLPKRESALFDSDSASEEGDGEIELTTEDDNSELEYDFSFPLEIGSLKIQNMQSLSRFLENLIRNVPVTSRRKIPVPNRSLDLFSSEDLCKVLSRDVGPARAPLDRIGQGLLNQEFAVNSALFASKSFRDHGMLLEWLEKAIKIAAMKGGIHESPKGDHSDRSVTSLRSRGRKDDPATAARSLQDMFLSVKQQFSKKTVPDQLDEVEMKYNEAHLRSMELRRKLESAIRSSATHMEQLERIKIELVHKSLAKVLELIYNSSLEATRELHALALRHINTINDPENYASDFEAAHSHFATGIFWPQERVIHNIRHLFDLYKDYLLQPKVSALPNGPDLLSIALIPQFLYGILTAVSTRQEPESSVLEAWCIPFNHNVFWQVKELVVERIAASNPEITANEEAAVHTFYTEVCIDEVAKHDTPIIINFLRGWLLETRDSVIPGLVFEKVILALKGPDGEAQLVKCLSAIPRSNLAALIYIMEHICGAAKLACILNYEICDDIVELAVEVDEKLLSQTANRLNDMSAVGAIPLMHLLLRPPVSKHSAGFHPPLADYLILSEHLMNAKLRQRLFEALLDNERKNISKRENEIIGMKRDLKPTALPQRSQSPQSSDNFSLRPFHKRVIGGSASPPNGPNRARNLSTVLPTSIEIEYEGEAEKKLA